MNSDLEALSVAELLRLHSEALEELRRRDVTRSANNPTGDLAETLFCHAFGWDQAPNSEKGFDATGSDGTRYQIKARRLTRPNTSRQLSAIRNLQDATFDVLAGILFDKHYVVIKAALIPRPVVEERATYNAYTNSHKFTLSDNVWDVSSVIDVTADLLAIKL